MKMKMKIDYYPGPPFEWSESTVLQDFDANFGKTFCKQEKDVDTQVTRFGRGLMSDGCQKSPLMQQVNSAEDLSTLSVSVFIHLLL